MHILCDLKIQRIKSTPNIFMPTLFFSFFGARDLPVPLLNGSTHCKLMLNKYFTEPFAITVMFLMCCQFPHVAGIPILRTAPRQSRSVTVSDNSRCFILCPPVDIPNSEVKKSGYMAPGTPVWGGLGRLGLGDFCGIKNTQKLRTGSSELILLLRLSCGAQNQEWRECRKHRAQANLKLGLQVLGCE